MGWRYLNICSTIWHMAKNGIGILQTIGFSIFWHGVALLEKMFVIVEGL